MNREREIDVLATALAMKAEKRRPLDADETLVSVTDYTDRGRFEREMVRVFRPALHLVALGAEMAQPGDFVTATLAGRPVLVTRDDAGVARAFLNVCRHRGATVERRERGHCKRFVCPYHAWTYDLDGALHRVRHPEGFPTLDPDAHGLVPLPCRELAGFVFVCPEPTGVELEVLPPALEEELAAIVGPRPVVCGRSARVWNANWKLVVEGGLESYHFVVAHKDTIASFFTDTLSTWERLGSHLRSVLPKRSIEELRDLPREQWRLRDHAHVVYTLHPNALLLVQPTHFDLIRMAPLDVDRTHIEVLTVGTAPEEGEMSAKARDFMAQNHSFSVKTLDEDFAIAEDIQRGIASGANTHFRFARFESALSDWRAWLDAQL